MTDMTTPPTPAEPTCQARTGLTPGAFGFIPVPCEQTRGLRVLIDAAGEVHRFCPAAGHAEAVAMRFGAIRQLMAMSRHDEDHDLYDRFDATCGDCVRSMDRAQEAAYS
jgi:hypothetical protein